MNVSEAFCIGFPDGGKGWEFSHTHIRDERMGKMSTCKPKTHASTLFFLGWSRGEKREAPPPGRGRERRDGRFAVGREGVFRKVKWEHGRKEGRKE